MHQKKFFETKKLKTPKFSETEKQLSVLVLSAIMRLTTPNNKCHRRVGGVQGKYIQ
jgi:hypothetical protein